MIDLEVLQSRLAEGAVALTPNRRLALRLRRDLARALPPETAALTPSIYVLGDWLERLWRGELMRLSEPQLVLSPMQEQQLWLQIVEQHAIGMSWLRPGMAARQAATAYRQLVLWQVDLHCPAVRAEMTADPDSAALLAWCDHFREQLAARNWLAAVDRDALLLERAQTGQLVLESPLITLALVDPPPLQRQLWEQASSWHPQALSATVGEARVVTAADEDEEIRLACRWLRAQRESGAGEEPRLALVVPDLARRRVRIQRLLAEEWDPTPLVGGSQRQPSVDLTAGTPLAETPLVRSALRLLQLWRGELALADVLALAQCPFSGLQFGTAWGVGWLEEVAALEQDPVTGGQLRRAAARGAERPPDGRQAAPGRPGGGSRCRAPPRGAAGGPVPAAHRGAGAALAHRPGPDRHRSLEGVGGSAAGSLALACALAGQHRVSAAPALATGPESICCAGRGDRSPESAGRLVGIAAAAARACLSAPGRARRPAGHGPAGDRGPALRPGLGLRHGSSAVARGGPAPSTAAPQPAKKAAHAALRCRSRAAFQPADQPRPAEPGPRGALQLSAGAGWRRAGRQPIVDRPARGAAGGSARRSAGCLDRPAGPATGAAGAGPGTESGRCRAAQGRQSAAAKPVSVPLPGLCRASPGRPGPARALPRAHSSGPWPARPRGPRKTLATPGGAAGPGRPGRGAAPAAGEPGGVRGGGGLAAAAGMAAATAAGRAGEAAPRAAAGPVAGRGGAGSTGFRGGGSGAGPLTEPGPAEPTAARRSHR